MTADLHARVVRLWLLSRTRKPRQVARTRAQAAYIVANHDWPAVAGLSPDSDAYDAIIAAWQRMTDEEYDEAMRQMSEPRRD